MKTMKRMSRPGHIALFLSVLFLGLLLPACQNTGRDPEQFFEAMQEKKYDKLASMIKKDGSKAGLVGTHGYSLLHLAIISGNADITSLLIAEGADLEFRAPSGHTALHLALQNGNVALVKILVDAGADIKAINPKDRSATTLKYAAVAGPVENARLLVEKGCEVNELDGIRANALNWAAWLGSLDMVKYLISVGGDLDIVDNYGDSPRTSAARNVNDPDRTILKYLESLEK